MKADLIIHGRIYPADGTGSFAEAMAIRNGKILAVGALKDLLPLAGSDTRSEEKPGLIIPGITEGHAHVTCASEMVFGLSLGSEDSPEKYLEKIRSFRAAHPDADYIVGSGYDNGVFGRQGPTAALMDKAVSDVPVVMIASDHHSRWLNTAALQKTGILPVHAHPHDAVRNGRSARDRHGPGAAVDCEGVLAVRQIHQRVAGHIHD